MTTTAPIPAIVHPIPSHVHALVPPSVLEALQDPALVAFTLPFIVHFTDTGIHNAWSVGPHLVVRTPTAAERITTTTALIGIGNTQATNALLDLQFAQADGSLPLYPFADRWTHYCDTDEPKHEVELVITKHTLGMRRLHSPSSFERLHHVLTRIAFQGHTGTVQARMRAQLRAKRWPIGGVLLPIHADTAHQKLQNARALDHATHVWKDMLFLGHHVPFPCSTVLEHNYQPWGDA